MNGPKRTPGIGVYVAAQGSYSFVEACDGIVGVEFKNVSDGKSAGTKVSKSGDNYQEHHPERGSASHARVRGQVKPMRTPYKHWEAP